MRLRKSTPAEAGIARRRRASGFVYLDARGEMVDAETEARVAALAVPPAWEDVWICADSNGHLQAVGTDAAGRLQYLYHPQWRARRDVAKFDRMLRFAAALPAARRRVSAQLSQPTPTRERALACAVRIADTALVRTGGEQYARTSGARGLVSMPCSCATISGTVLRLRFTGKSGVEHDITIEDRRLTDALRPLVARAEGSSRRTPLLAHQSDGGWRRITSAELNDYVRKVIGPEFTIKDFRTWHATVVATEELQGRPRPSSRREEATAVRAASERAAELLGNTPAVARSSYIDPRLFEEYARHGIPRRRGRSPESVVRSLLG